MSVASYLYYLFSITLTGLSPMGNYISPIMAIGGVLVSRYKHTITDHVIELILQ